MSSPRSGARVFKGLGLVPGCGDLLGSDSAGSDFGSALLFFGVLLHLTQTAENEGGGSPIRQSVCDAIQVGASYRVSFAMDL